MTPDTPSPEEILALLPAHQGHFRFESGHHGTRWLDVERLYLHPPRVQRLAVLIAGRIAKYDVQVVCKPLVEGAFAAEHGLVLEALASLPNDLWTPDECPFCVAAFRSWICSHHRLHEEEPACAGPSRRWLMSSRPLRRRRFARPRFNSSES